jgi:hypothetical protein
LVFSRTDVSFSTKILVLVFFLLALPNCARHHVLHLLLLLSYSNNEIFITRPKIGAYKTIATTFRHSFWTLLWCLLGKRGCWCHVCIASPCKPSSGWPVECSYG